MNALLATPAQPKLTALELTRLGALETVIDAGIKTFVAVGCALGEIRDRRLYRAQFATFEDYCRDRYGLERRHAYRLIDAANVVENVSNWTQTADPAWPGGISCLPLTESTARPLTVLNPDEQGPVWQVAVETAPAGKITAAHVQTVVDAYRTPHVARNSGNNEWYTPAEYITAARAVMGQIDLDPASSPEANAVVRASQFYTAQDDGLSLPWYGRVWLNPPYAKDLIGEFIGKLCQTVKDGHVNQAIVLVNNATETAWFQELMTVAAAIIFPRGRVRYWRPNDDEAGAPLQGQAIVYTGHNPADFLTKFAQFGRGCILVGVERSMAA